jgi:hypothetical protein
LSGLALDDRIKAMYMTMEGLTNAGISTVQEKLDLEDLRNRGQQNTTRNMGNQGGGASASAGGGNRGGGAIRIGG